MKARFVTIQAGSNSSEYFRCDISILYGQWKMEYSCQYFIDSHWLQVF